MCTVAWSKKKNHFLFQPFLFLFILSFPLSHSLKLIVVPGREHPWCSDQDSPATTWLETSRPHSSRLVEFRPWGQPSRSCSNSKSPLNRFRNRNQSTSHSHRTRAPTSKTSARCPEPRTAPPCHLYTHTHRHRESNRSTETPPIASHTDRTPNRTGSNQTLRTCHRNTHRRGRISLEIWGFFFFFFFFCCGLVMVVEGVAMADGRVVVELWLVLWLLLFFLVVGYIILL